jgi:hypothetical protein
MCVILFHAIYSPTRFGLAQLLVRENQMQGRTYMEIQIYILIKMGK